MLNRSSVVFRPFFSILSASEPLSIPLSPRWSTCRDFACSETEKSRSPKSAALAPNVGSVPTSSDSLERSM